MKKHMLIRTVTIIVIVLLSIFFFTTGTRSGAKTPVDTTQIVTDSTSNFSKYTKRALMVFFREMLKKAFNSF